MYLLRISGPLTEMKLSPHSFATAEAKRVFPHPGYPYNSNLCTLRFLSFDRGIARLRDREAYPDRNLKGQEAKIAPYFVGHSNVSLNVFLVSCNPPISLHCTSDFCNLTSRRERGVNPTCALLKSSAVSTRSDCTCKNFNPSVLNRDG